MLPRRSPRLPVRLRPARRPCRPMGVLNAALSANPIGLVIVAIVALVAAGVLIYKNWDTIKAKLLELWAKMKEVWERIKTIRSGDDGKGSLNSSKSIGTRSWRSSSRYPVWRSWYSVTGGRSKRSCRKFSRRYSSSETSGRTSSAGSKASYLNACSVVIGAKIKEAVEDILKNVFGFFGDLWSNITDWFTKFDLAETFTKFWGGVKETVGGIWDGIVRH